MGILEAVWAGAAGVVAAPWLRAVIFRHSVPAQGSQRYDCPACGVELQLAWLPISGRCPACCHQIGPRAGTVEVATTGVCVLLAIRVESPTVLAALCWLAMAGLALAVIDIAVHRLPNAITYPTFAGVLALLALAAVAEHRPEPALDAAAGALLLFGGYSVIAVLTTGLGFGDCKLAAPIGAALGWFGWRAVLTGTVLAFLLAAGVGLALIASRRLRRADPMPLGPFMIVGTEVALLV